MNYSERYIFRYGKPLSKSRNYSKPNNPIFLWVVLFCFSQLAFSYPYDPALDSLKKEIKTSQLIQFSKTDKKIVDSLNLVAWEFRKKDYDSTILNACLALVIAERISYPFGIAQSYNRLGVINDYKGNYDIADDYYQNAIAIFRQVEEPQELIRTYLLAGNVLKKKGELIAATEVYYRGLKIAEQNSFHRLSASFYSGIAASQARLNNYKAAKESYEKALALMELANAPDKNKAPVIYNYATLLATMGERDSALVQMLQVEVIFDSLDYTQNRAQVFDAIGRIYYLDSLYQQSIVYYDQSLKLKKAIGAELGMAFSHFHLGDVKMAQGKYKDAQLHYDTCIDLSSKDRETLFFEPLSSTYLSLSKLHERTGNISEALKAFKTHVEYRDTLQQKNARTAITEIEKKYENQKKTLQLKEEKARSDLNVQRQRNAKNIITFLFVLGLILAVWTFFTGE